RAGDRADLDGPARDAPRERGHAHRPGHFRGRERRHVRAAGLGRPPARRGYRRARRRRRDREVPRESQVARGAVPRREERGAGRPDVERRRAPGGSGDPRRDRRPRPARLPVPGVLMAAVLHLIKGSETGLARAVLDRNLRAGDRVTVVVLPGGAGSGLPAGVTVRSLDGDLSYDQLLGLIFEADQVVTW